MGAGGVKTRHDSMTVGELDVDYVMFGDPAPDGWTPPLEQVAEGYRAMDERRSIKTLLRP